MEIFIEISLEKWKWHFFYCNEEPNLAVPTAEIQGTDGIHLLQLTISPDFPIAAFLSINTAEPHGDQRSEVAQKGRSFRPHGFHVKKIG